MVQKAWTWWPPDNDQRTLSPGVYFIMLKHGEGIIARKAVKEN